MLLPQLSHKEVRRVERRGYTPMRLRVKFYCERSRPGGVYFHKPTRVLNLDRVKDETNAKLLFEARTWKGEKKK